MLRRGMTGEDRGKKKKYDTKCEVYSFGILLWEIAECRTSYSQFDDFMEITYKVINGYRESFTPGIGIPRKYQTLVIEAINQNPSHRPILSKTLIDLQDIFKNYTFEQPTSHSDLQTPPPVRNASDLNLNWDYL